MFGAFLFGAIIPARSRLAGSTLSSAETFGRLLLLPSFFAITGLGTEIRALTVEGALLTLLVILVAAIFGKFAETLLAARFSEPGWNEGSVLGILTNTRSLEGLSVLNVGLDLLLSRHRINPKLFSILVFMALFTT